MLESITIEDLVEELQKTAKRHPGLRVITSSDYGDHCHTEQAAPIIQEPAEIVRLCESGYSASGYEVIHEDDRYGRWQECEDDEKFILLRQWKW